MTTPSCTSSRPCGRCSGSGSIFRQGFTFDGRTYPDRTESCYSCEGRGSFVPPVTAEIVEAIRGRKGLRSRRPDDDRAYYVWRMARFHGGVDVTMPVVASTVVRNDPFLPELDALADSVAKAVFGTNMAAAYRWAPLLANPAAPAPTGLPATAYSGGPVCTVDKPAEELLELC